MAKCILRSMPVESRRGGHHKHAAVGRLQRPLFRRAGHRGARQAGSVRDGQDRARMPNPLLRRPFSIFEVLRDTSGDATGISILNKRVGVGTARLYEVEPGTHLPVLGPLGIPFEPVSPPAEAWMVAGGVGLAPFLTLAEALRDAGNAYDPLLRRAAGVQLYAFDTFTRLGMRIELATEDGSRGSRGFVTPRRSPKRSRPPVRTSTLRPRLDACRPSGIRIRSNSTSVDRRP